MSDWPAMLDISVLIARESGGRISVDDLPDRTAVSVVTLAELQVGVLAATDVSTRAVRLATLEAISAVEALPVTAEAARRWAELRVRLAETATERRSTTSGSLPSRQRTAWMS